MYLKECKKKILLVEIQHVITDGGKVATSKNVFTTLCCYAATQNIPKYKLLLNY